MPLAIVDCGRKTRRMACGRDSITPGAARVVTSSTQRPRTAVEAAAPLDSTAACTTTVEASTTSTMEASAATVETAPATTAVTAATAALSER